MVLGGQPVYFYKFFDMLKFRIAGQNNGIFLLGRGDRKAICKRKRMSSFYLCGTNNSIKIIWDYRNGESCQNRVQKIFGLFMTASAIENAIGFTDIQFIHQNWEAGFPGICQYLAHLVKAVFLIQVG